MSLPAETTQPPGPVNRLTVDVEDYFQVSAFEAVCPPESWGTREVRVEGNTEKILDLLAEHGVTATFFVLGWVAERCPGLVRRIASEGHEVASHGYGHRRVNTQTRDEFRADVRRAKALLEDLAGAPVLGYRAPSYSIGRTCLWAFDELAEAGHAYDSSVFPVRHDLYGLADWPRFPFHLERLDGQGEHGNWVPAESGEGPAGGGQPGGGARLLEIPITTLRLLGRNLPIAGGGYFRFFPYAFTRWGLGRINREEGRPFVFYLHPWELDPEQPRICGAGLKSRFRHYLNLSRTEARFRRLLTDFRFGPMRDVGEPGLGAVPDGIDRPAATEGSSLPSHGVPG
ncbi:MAG: XrtA system polysaccharide deacetylase [Deferrisomatales bacterium]